MAETSKNPVVSVRVPELTRNQIDSLTEKWGISMASLVTVLVDRAYQQEIITMQPATIPATFDQPCHADVLLELLDTAPAPSTDWHIGTATRAELLDAAELIDDLADYWPQMPELDGGVDRFSQYPVTGTPQE